jgi:hypothetical protein
MQNTRIQISHPLLCMLAADKTMLLFPLSQHCTATMIIVILRYQTVLWIIPREYSAHDWDFPMITVTLFWFIWLCPLTDKTIRIWSTAYINRSQVLLPNCSHSITYYLITSSSGTAALSSSTYFPTTLHDNKYNFLSCGKHEGTSANHPSPTNTR